ncbi:hypothetical protein ACFOZ5_16470 [Marinobacter lacisalsi]|uniref:Lipoprotein n=1 Tax=Marinobacter lacisalsi TaxID=475979 RepID=A0ABV8QM21_9GAMM
MQLANRLLGAFLIVLSGCATAQSPEVIEEEGAFYARLSITPSELLRTKQLMDRELAYRFSDGGMFEIYLPGEKLGSIAKGCDSLIVRMPWTDPELPSAQEFVQEKKALFTRLSETSKGHSVEFVVQLNPYVEVIDGAPELTSCNLFFRHHDGQYIESIDPLP